MDAQSIRANFEARSKAAADLRALYEEAAGREMTAEERQTEERLAAAIEEYDRRVQAGLKAVEEERAAREAFEASGIEPEARDREPRTEERSEADILRELARGETRSVEFAPETRANEHVIDAGGADPKVAGGYTVKPSFYMQIMEALEEHSTVILSGATVLRTSKGEDIFIPKATEFPQAQIVAELDPLANERVTFAQETIKAYKFGFTMEASSELLTDSAVDIASYLARKGGEALGWGLGEYAMRGTGSNQPQGILVTSGGFDSVDAAAGSVNGLTVEDVIDLVYSVARPYRSGASFIASDAAVKGLRKLREDNGKGQFLWQPSVRAGEPDTLAGYPIVTDPAMDEGDTAGDVPLVFGNWKKGVTVRFAGPVRVEASRDFRFDTDAITWRFITRFDSRIVDTNAAKRLVVKAGSGGG